MISWSGFQSRVVTPSDLSKKKFLDFSIKHVTNARFRLHPCLCNVLVGIELFNFFQKQTIQDTYIKCFLKTKESIVFKSIFSEPSCISGIRKEIRSIFFHNMRSCIGYSHNRYIRMVHSKLSMNRIDTFLSSTTLFTSYVAVRISGYLS